MARRARNYIAKVEGELLAIFRDGRDLSDPNYQSSPNDFINVKNAAKRALEALGWTVEDDKQAPPA